jgi:hypothetical protein
MPKDRKGFDNIFIIVDRLSKKPILVPYYKTIRAKGLAEVYIYYVYRYYRVLDSIILDRGPQFVSEL